MVHWNPAHEVRMQVEMANRAIETDVNAANQVLEPAPLPKVCEHRVQQRVEFAIVCLQVLDACLARGPADGPEVPVGPAVCGGKRGEVLREPVGLPARFDRKHSMIAQRLSELDDLSIFENNVLLAVIGVGVFAGMGEPLRNAVRKRIRS
jgi:hypothetical protein